MEILDHLAKSSVCFGAIVGNPPYQAQPEGDRLQASPIFHRFNRAARDLPTRAISLIYPAKWLYWERGDLGDFADAEYQSGSYAYFRDFSSSLDVFGGGIEIAGGVCFFLLLPDGAATRYSYNGEADVERRGIIGPRRVRDPRADAIVEKLGTYEQSMAKLVGAYGHYLGAEVTSNHVEAAHDPAGEDQVYYLKDRGVAKIPVKPNFLRRTAEGHKVFVSKTANGRQASLPRADRIFLGQPGEAAAVSFLRVGLFDTPEEARNCMVYLKTDLCNFLVGLRAITHNTTSKTYSLVPLVNFQTGEVSGTSHRLDFTGPDIHAQLCSIYGLDEQDQKYLRSRLKPWAL